MKSTISRRVIANTIAKKLLTEPAKRGHWLRVLAAYIVEHKLEQDVDFIVNDMSREIAAQGGDLLVSVTSARPLNEALRRELQATLQMLTEAKHVVLREQIDNDLLGGFVVRTPDAELDASVRTKLQRLAAIK